jgi:hypothetical protein
VKVTARSIPAPSTATEPEEGVAVYPFTLPTVYGRLPFASWKVIVLEAAVSGTPPRATDHSVPAGSPVSVKVTG